MLEHDYEIRQEGKAWLEPRKITVNEIVEFGDGLAKQLYDYGKGKALTVIEAVISNEDTVKLKAAKSLIEDVISHMADDAGCQIRSRFLETKYPE